jgi:hypothetical protein
MSRVRKEITIPEARKFSEVYNTLRQNWHPSHTFTFNELHDVFKNAGFPCTAVYVRAYPKYGLLIHNKRGSYSFPAEPVHFNVIRQCIESVRRSSSKKNQKVTTPKPAVKIQNPALNVDACVAFLKEKGYLILKIC